MELTEFERTARKWNYTNGTGSEINGPDAENSKLAAKKCAFRPPAVLTRLRKARAKRLELVGYVSFASVHSGRNTFRYV